MKIVRNIHYDMLCSDCASGLCLEHYGANVEDLGSVIFATREAERIAEEEGYPDRERYFVAQVVTTTTKNDEGINIKKTIEQTIIGEYYDGTLKWW